MVVNRRDLLRAAVASPAQVLGVEELASQPAPAIVPSAADVFGELMVWGKELVPEMNAYETRASTALLQLTTPLDSDEEEFTSENVFPHTMAEGTYSDQIGRYIASAKELEIILPALRENIHRFADIPLEGFFNHISDTTDDSFHTGKLKELAKEHGITHLQPLLKKVLETGTTRLQYLSAGLKSLREEDCKILKEIPEENARFFPEGAQEIMEAAASWRDKIALADRICLLGSHGMKDPENRGVLSYDDVIKFEAQRGKLIRDLASQGMDPEEIGHRFCRMLDLSRLQLIKSPDELLDRQFLTAPREDLDSLLHTSKRKLIELHGESSKPTPPAEEIDDPSPISDKRSPSLTVVAQPEVNGRYRCEVHAETNMSLRMFETSVRHLLGRDAAKCSLLPDPEKIDNRTLLVSSTDASVIDGLVKMIGNQREVSR